MSDPHCPPSFLQTIMRNICWCMVIVASINSMEASAGGKPPKLARVSQGYAKLDCTLNDTSDIETQSWDWKVNNSSPPRRLFVRWPNETWDGIPVFNNSGKLDVSDDFELILHNITPSMFGYYECVVSLRSNGNEQTISTYFLNDTGEEPPTTDQTPTSSSPHPASPQNIIIIVIVVLVLLGLCVFIVCGFIYWRRHREDSPISTTSNGGTSADGGNDEHADNNRNVLPSSIPSIDDSETVTTILPLLSVPPQSDGHDNEEVERSREDEENMRIAERKRVDLHSFAQHLCNIAPAEANSYQREKNKILATLRKYSTECDAQRPQEGELRDPPFVSAKTFTECSDCKALQEQSSEGDFAIFVATFLERVKCMSKEQARKIRGAILGGITPSPEADNLQKNPFLFTDARNGPMELRDDAEHSLPSLGGRASLYADVLHRVLCHRFCLLVMAELPRDKTRQKEAGRHINREIANLVREWAVYNGPTVNTEDILERIDARDMQTFLAAKFITESLAEASIDRVHREEIMLRVLQNLSACATREPVADEEN